MLTINRNHSSIITAVLAVITILLLLSLTPGSADACSCLSGVDNFCLYPPSTAGCSMTSPGGYCDPNGDGDFADADWAKGYYEYQAACPDGGTNPPPPPPSGGNDYSDWIYGIHWYGDNYAGTDVEAMTGGKGIWVMETVTIWDGWTIGDQLQKFNTIVDRGHTLILRIQPRWGWSIPPPGPERQQYLDAVEAAARQAKNVSHIWQIGNEMNLYGEYGGGVLTAQEYINYFKQIRQRIQNVSSPLGPQIVLVGPVSPGAYAGEVRHTDGLQYLGQMCALLNANDFDGFALHAYGAPWLDANGARWDFQNGSGGYAAQLGVIDNHGFPDKPAFILEWNRQTPDEESGQEAQTAQFIIGAYQDLQTWNNNPNNHPVVCATWFIYADISPWEIFSLRGLRDQNPRGVNQDVWDSFQYACSLNISAGDMGSGPTPPPPPNPETPPGDNLALDASDWSASSEYNGDFGGDKAYDGTISAGSKWTSDGSSAASWMALDLGTNCDLTGFVVRHAGAGGEPTAYNTRSYRLESGTSLSGPWTTLATVDNAAQQDSSTTVLANNATTRYVRLYIIDAGIDNYARIPEFEVYGSTGSTPPPPPTAGPLTNGSFEDAVQGNGVGQGWYSFSSSGYGPTYAVVSDPVYDGSAAQQMVSPQPSTSNQYAGVYQVVATESGSDYVVRAWNRTHFAGGSAWDHIARLGIDLSGGTDFQASSVEWYEFDSAKDTWHLLELNLTATDSAMTIFLQSWHKWASGGGAYTWFDHVAVATDDQPPPPPPNPGTPPGDNLALGASDRSASSVYNGDFGGDKAYDGVISAGSKWTSDGSSAASWLALDLGTNCDLTGFIVRHAGAAGEPAAYNTQSYRLESGSSLAGPWTALAAVDNSAQQNSSTTVLSNNATTRYVRLYIIDAGIDNYARIPEFEVYGSAGSTPPPPPGNNPPTAAATANPTSGIAPLTVSFDANGSSDPDGDSLSYSWNFGDGTQGSGATVSHTYQTQGIYPATLTVDDGRGGSDDVTATIAVSTTGPPLPSYCPSTLDFPAIRAQLNQQGEDLAFVKIGFHVGPGGNQNGLGEWMTCLDAAGVPFFLKSVDSAGQIWEAAQLKAASGVPHVLVYRRSTGSGWNWDVPDYNKTPYDAAVEHWQRQRQEFPPELEPYKNLIWIESINEVDKNRSEWLAEFSYHTAQMAMDQGFNWAAFGWSAGEPEREHWEGPWMRQFLELASNNPDRVAVALHEYSYVRDNLDRLYPNLVGRFQMLFDVCDTAGIARPKVLVTEFGWVYDDIANSVQQAMEVDLPWAAGLYADFPRVLGASIWYLGPGFGGIANHAQQLIAPLTAYALQEYFVVPLESAPPPPTGPESITGGEPKGPFGSGEQSDEVTEPETWRWSERFYGHQGIDQITWQADSCGVQHNYAIGWHRNDLVEYLMKFGGNYSRLTLRGLADRPGPVQLEIYIDGNYAATAVWDNDNDCNQDTAVQIGGIPYGTHAIAVKFVNDHYDPGTGADRNFYLDGLRVVP